MMYNPPHPGEMVLEECIKPLGLTITAAASSLGVSRKTLSELVNGKFGVSADMALRLSKVFGGSAEIWLRLQSKHDLWEATQRMKKWKPKTSYIGQEARV
ncbi:MAG: HigA family addiction module antitoxin [Alphaproteobacteria bacterium]|nr:HigA family addiction module antitoxin [Alphaproteobacteria bacterium]